MPEARAVQDPSDQGDLPDSTAAPVAAIPGDDPPVEIVNDGKQKGIAEESSSRVRRGGTAGLTPQSADLSIKPDSSPALDAEGEGDAQAAISGNGRGQRGRGKRGRSAGGSSARKRPKKQQSRLATSILGSASKDDKQQLAGMRCEVWWDGEQQFFPGVVAEYLADKDAFVVEYEDGDVDAGLCIHEYEVKGKGRQRLLRVLRSGPIDDSLYLVAPKDPAQLAGQAAEEGSTGAADLNDAAPTADRRARIDGAAPSVPPQANAATVRAVEGRVDVAEEPRTLDQPVGEVAELERAEAAVAQRARVDVGLPHVPAAAQPDIAQDAGIDGPSEQRTVKEGAVEAVPANGPPQMPLAAALDSGLLAVPEPSAAHADEPTHKAVNAADLPLSVAAPATAEQTPESAEGSGQHSRKADTANATASVSSHAAHAWPSGQQARPQASHIQRPESGNRTSGSAGPRGGEPPRDLPPGRGARGGAERAAQEAQPPPQPSAGEAQRPMFREGGSSGSEPGSDHHRAAGSTPGVNLGAGKGVCRWRSPPGLSAGPHQPGDLPLLGRIRNWPFATLLPQARHPPATEPAGGSPAHSATFHPPHAQAARAWTPPQHLPPPITLAAPPGPRLPDTSSQSMRIQLLRQKQALADAERHGSTPPPNQAPDLVEEPSWQEKKALLPSEPSHSRPLLPPLPQRPSGPAAGLLAPEQVAVVRQRAEAAARLASERLLKEGRDTRSSSKDRRSERELGREGQGDRERQRHEAIKRDAEARRRREQEEAARRTSEEPQGRGSHPTERRDGPSRQDRDRQRERERDRGREPERRDGRAGERDRHSGGKPSRVVYLSDKTRVLPGNRSPSRPASLSQGRDWRSSSADRGRGHSQQEGRRGGSTRSRSRSRYHAEDDRRGKRQRRSRGRSASGSEASSSSDSRSHAARNSSRGPSTDGSRGRRANGIGCRLRPATAERSAIPASASEEQQPRNSSGGDSRHSSELAMCTKEQGGLTNAPANSIIPLQGRFKRGRVLVCSISEAKECQEKGVIGSQRPSDVEEIDERTALFLYLSDSQELAGIFCGDRARSGEEARQKLDSGPFKYQVPMRVWRPADKLPIGIAKAAVGPHPNAHSRWPIKEYLSEKQVRTLCEEFSNQMSPH